MVNTKVRRHLGRGGEEMGGEKKETKRKRVEGVERGLAIKQIK